MSANGLSVSALAAPRTGVRPGSVFLIAGLEEGNANSLLNGAPPTVEVRPA